MDRISNYIAGVFNYARIALLDINFVDILDILVVAALLYWVLTIVFRTGASRIVRVVALLLVLAGLARAIGMDTLNFILGNTLQLGVLALIILFQPELRRVLETISSRSVLELFETKSTEDDTLQVLQTVVDTCADLAATKTGALIVFEMDNKLDTYLATGTRLDAMVSEQMLKNLFFPKAALHDGAVVIRGDRIVAAGCVLPLSENLNLSQDLGTRHRAGVGITEKTDAVVLIVSEETGMVSLAENGFLRRYWLDAQHAALGGEDAKAELLRRLRLAFGLNTEEKERTLATWGSRLVNSTFKGKKDEDSEHSKETP